MCGKRIAGWASWVLLLVGAVACGGTSTSDGSTPSRGTGTPGGGDGGTGGAGGSTAIGGTPSAGGSAGAPASGSGGELATGGTGGIPATGGTAGEGTGGDSGAAGAGGAAACDPYGMWIVTYGDEPLTPGETRFCAPSDDQLIVEPGDEPGTVKIAFLGRVAGESNCGPPDLFPIIQESHGTISEDGCTITAATDLSWCYSGETQGETRELSLTVSGDSASGTLQHQPRQCPACGGPSCPEVPFEATAARAGVTDPEFHACVERYSSSGCVPEPMCMDGITEIVLYPESAGTFPSPADMWAPPELLEVGLAYFIGSVCTCAESWQLKHGDDWLEVGPTVFCAAISYYDSECSGCLTEWMGGCC